MEASLQKYVAFAAAVERGSFSGAAAKLNYSQSAVSRMIADLEAEWGITLFERRKGGVRLTDDGAKVLPYVKNICKEHDNLQMQVDEINGLQSGLIRIGTFSSGASLWLPDIIKGFQEDYPNIDYEVMIGDYTEIEQWILDGTVDCGFLSLPVSSKLKTVFLERDQLLAVLPPDHPLAHAESFPAAALADEPLMLLEKGNGAEVREKILKKHGLNPRINFTTWDDYAIMAMVEKGLGVSVLTEMIMRRCPYNVAAKSFEEPVYRDVVMAFRAEGSASLALQRFMAYLPLRDQNAS